MSTVLAMRLNQDQAVLLTDESTWHLGHVFGYRRTNYGDGLTSLISPKTTAESGLGAVYAGVGFPSFHSEVARRVESTLPPEGPASNDHVARLTHEAFVATHQRLIDDKLRFDFGFSLAELNARRYGSGEQSREIKQGPVVAAARALAGGGGTPNVKARIYSNQGLMVARDRDHGVQCWYLEPQGRHMGFATPIATIGDGGDLASHLMAEYLERRHSGRRRQGYGREEGLFIAMRIAVELQRRVGTMGGYLQVMLLDGDKGVSELVSDACKLAAEITQAHQWGFLPADAAEAMVSGLLLEGAEVDAVETALFAAVGDKADDLERYLMGFKPDATPLAKSQDQGLGGR